ncbi:heparinase II/III-like protein [Kribbella rubisoli]|uniref:Heparinase II/III-like protein n=1 Tax=Kribbella rubisoli TaxID=3075929 RepID=A0A4Q7XKE6_9ACTN|nr:heparinase II/III family protein [Kribbella rubisoli]RZU24297.1 heparinase II/III-like protein [Kribbella rubisoli]
MSTGPEKPRHIDGRINQIGTDDLLKAFGSPAEDLAGLRAFVGARMQRPAWPLPDPADGVLEAAAPLLDGVDVTGLGKGRSQLYGFHYLGWLKPGVDAWLLTGDDRYLQAFERHLDEWVERRDSVTGEWPGLDVIWYSLGTWARCRNLLPTLEVLTPSSLSDRAWGRLVATLVGGARWAYDEHDVFRHGNWQLVCATELLHISAVLPSLVESAAWAGRARERIEEHLALDIYPDGGHYERSPGYHGMVLSALQTAARIDSEVAGHPRYAAMHTWLRELVSSGGWVPHLQDSGIVWPAAMLERGGSLPLELPLATVLPESGYTILRSDELRAVINHGPHIEHELESHSHRAVLDLVLDGWGEPLLWEAGGPPSYDDPGYVSWYQSGRGHNTVLVDDRELSTDRQVSVDPLVDTGPVAVFNGRHHGNGLEQSRTIAMVREEPAYVVVTDRASGPHTFRAMWHALHPWQQVGPLAYAAERLLLLEAGDPATTVVGTAEGTARRPVLESQTAEYGPLHSLSLERSSGDFTTVLVPYADDVAVTRVGGELLVTNGPTTDRIGASTWIRSVDGKLSWATGWRVRELPSLVRSTEDITVLAESTRYDVTCSARCDLSVHATGELRLNGIVIDAAIENGWAHLTLPYAGRWTVESGDGS